MAARDREVSRQLPQNLTITVEEAEAGGAVCRHLHLDALAAAAIHEPHSGCAVAPSADPDSLPIVLASQTAGYAQAGHPIVLVGNPDKLADSLLTALRDR